MSDLKATATRMGTYFDEIGATPRRRTRPTKPRADDNERLIREVFAELATQHPEDLHYTAFDSRTE